MKNVQSIVYQVVLLKTELQSYNYLPSYYSQCTQSNNIVEEDCLECVSGYVAHRFANEFPWLAKGTCSTADNENSKTWTEQISKKNLTIASDELFKSTKRLEDLFNKFVLNWCFKIN